MHKKCIGIILLILTCFLLLAGCGKENQEPTDAYNTINCRILKASADNWTAVSGDSVVCGESGDGIGIESIGVELINPIKPGAIEFMICSQFSGWGDWTTGSDTSGRPGSGNLIEALKMRLTGSIADTYSVFYRVSITDMGWSKWTANGEPSGIEGSGKTIEAVAVKLVLSEGIVPDESAAQDESATQEVFVPLPQFSVYNHETGWRESDGMTAGDAAGGRQIECFMINMTGNIYQGSIVYRTYAESYGWLGWMMDGQISGAEGEVKRAEGIQIKLTDELADKIDVYYRVYVSGIGWLGWAKNGQPAGTKGLSRMLDSIQIVFRGKDAEPPGEVAYASISGSEDPEIIDPEAVINAQRDRMMEVGRYYVEDTEGFKYRNGTEESTEAEPESGEVQTDVQEIIDYCAKNFNSGLVQVDLSKADGDMEQYCVQELLKFYLNKGPKTIFYTEFIGYTMDNAPVFRCYYSRG